MRRFLKYTGSLTLFFALIGFVRPDHSFSAGVAFFGETLCEATAHYVVKNGLPAFMDEYYFLMGTYGLRRARKHIYITDNNRKLISALWPRQTRGFRHGNPEITLRVSTFHGARFELAGYFRDADIPGITEAQRLFLEWHFTARRNYDSVLTRGGDKTVVGWNVFAEQENTGEYTFYTFGLIGCTAVFAVSESGDAAHFSHYADVVNPEQIRVLDNFLKRHGRARIYVVGEMADRMASEISERHPGLAVWFHKKEPIQWEGPASAEKPAAYSIRIRQAGKNTEFAYCHKIIKPDYLSSIQTRRENEIWPGYGDYNGRFGSICPEIGCRFKTLDFEQADGSPR